MNCLKCGAPVGEEADFCSRCGAAVQRLAATMVAEPSRFCVRCGAGLGVEDRFCPKCGAKVQVPAVPSMLRWQRRRYLLVGGALVLLLLLALGGAIGYRAWREGQALEAHYDTGVAALQAGDYRTALQELTWVVDRSPDDLNAQALQAVAQTQVDQADLLAQAQADNERGQWDSALRALETLQAQAPGYEAGRVADLLFLAHLNAGLSAADQAQFGQAVQHLSQALLLRPDDGAERQKQLASLYPQGLTTLDQGECASAQDALREVYALDPGYHQVTDKLYQAGTCVCEQLTEQGRLDQAEAECQTALQLKPAGQEAMAGLARIVSLRTPTATPTWTPSPTPTDTPTPVATATPTVTPTPKKAAQPRCRKAAPGLIGFKRQTRCNAKTGAACGAVEMWVMNTDGSGQAPMCNKEAYFWGLERDRTSQDGEWRVEVSAARPDIMRLWLKTGRQEMIIVNNRVDWDPVLSADSWWLAWVTNRNANDEIYIKTMDPKDQNQRRLTVNTWEWDKHPTWSPDGRKIAFYSNRADSLKEATRQIWVMEIVSDKGVNLRNLSQRPDKVDTDPVWFKWDNIPQ